jgi:hypothetical protein
VCHVSYEAHRSSTAARGFWLDAKEQSGKNSKLLPSPNAKSRQGSDTTSVVGDTTLVSKQDSTIQNGRVPFAGPTAKTHGMSSEDVEPLLAAGKNAPEGKSKERAGVAAAAAGDKVSYHHTVSDKSSVDGKRR